MDTLNCITQFRFGEQDYNVVFLCRCDFWEKHMVEEDVFEQRRFARAGPANEEVCCSIVRIHIVHFLLGSNDHISKKRV